jgi:long-chain acyl-CoA synthetase
MGCGISHHRRTGSPDGEQVKAVVQPADGDLPGPAVAAELLASRDGRLATMKWPRTVDFIEEMPRDPSGKPQQRQLRDLYCAGRDRPI